MSRKSIGTTGLLATAICLIALSLAPLAAHARGRGRHEPAPERVVERLSEQLDLSDEQAEQVRQILDRRFEERRELRDSHRQEMEEFRAQTEGEIAEVLTAEQLEEMRRLREERRQRRMDCYRWDSPSKEE